MPAESRCANAQRTRGVGPDTRATETGCGTIPGLSVQVRDDGRVHARIAESGVFNPPPRLVGRITDGSNGVVLDAPIKGSRKRGVESPLFRGLAVFTRRSGCCR